MEMPGRRSLTRNPLTPWQRLVDDNLNSLGDSTRKSWWDKRVNVISDGEKNAAKSPTSTIDMKVKGNNESSKSFESSMSSQINYLNCSRRHNESTNEKIANRQRTNRSKDHTPDLARSLFSTNEQKIYEKNVEDKTGTKQMEYEKQSTKEDFSSNRPKKMHSIREKYDIMGNKRHTFQAYHIKQQSLPCKEFQTCQSHESKKYPMSIHSTKNSDAIEINCQKSQSSSCHRYRRYKAKLHEPRAVNNKERFNNKRDIILLPANYFSLNEAFNSRISSANLQRLFNTVDANMTTVNKLFLSSFFSKGNLEGGDVGNGIWSSNLQIIGGVEEKNTMEPLKFDIDIVNISEPSKLLKDVGISEELISKRTLNSETEMPEFELSHVDFGAGGDSTFQAREIPGSNTTDPPFRMSTSNLLDEKLRRRNEVEGQCYRYDLCEDFENIMNRMNHEDKHVTAFHKEYRRRSHRCGSYKMKFRRSLRELDVYVEDKKSLEVGREFNRLDLDIGDGLQNSFQNTPLAEHSEEKECNLFNNNDSDLLEYEIKNKNIRIQDSFSSQNISDHQIVKQAKDKKDSDRPYIFRFHNTDNNTLVAIKRSTSELNIRKRGKEWENIGFWDSTRESTEFVNKCNSDNTRDILKSETTLINHPETYKSLSENKKRKYNLSTTNTLTGTSDNRMKVLHKALSENSNDFRSRIGYNLHVTTVWKESDKFKHNSSRNQQPFFYLDKTLHIVNNTLHILDQGERCSPSSLHDCCKDAKDSSYVMEIDSKYDAPMLRLSNIKKIIETHHNREKEKQGTEKRSLSNVNWPKESYTLYSELELNDSDLVTSVQEKIHEKPIFDRLLSKEIKDNMNDPKLRCISEVDFKQKKYLNTFAYNTETTSNENKEILLNQELLSKENGKDMDVQEPSSIESMSLDKTDTFMKSNSGHNYSDHEIFIRERTDTEFSLTNKQRDKNVFISNKNVDNNVITSNKSKDVCVSHKEMDKDVFGSNKMKDLNLVIDKTDKDVYVSNDEKGRNISLPKTAMDKRVLESMEKMAKDVHLSNKVDSGEVFMCSSSKDANKNTILSKESEYTIFVPRKETDKEVFEPNTKAYKAILTPNLVSNILDLTLKADKEVLEIDLKTDEDIHFLNKEAGKSVAVANKEITNNVFVASKSSDDDTALLPFKHPYSNYDMKKSLCNNGFRTKERRKANIERTNSDNSIAKNISLKLSALWDNKHHLQKDCIERPDDQEDNFSKSITLPEWLPKQQKKKPEMYIDDETNLDKSNTRERSPNSTFSWNTPSIDNIVLPNKNGLYEMSVQIVQPQQNCDFCDLYVNKLYKDEGTQRQVDYGNQNKYETENEFLSILELTDKSQNYDDLSQSSLECLLEQLIHRGKITKAYVISLDREIMAQSKSASISHSDVIALCDGIMGHYDGLIKITVFNVVYTCFHSNNYTLLIGRATDSVLVIKLASFSLVAGFAPPYTNGSCLKEITEFAEVLKARGL